MKITTPKACPNHAVRYTVFEQRSVGIDSFSRNSLCFSPSVDDGELNIYSHKKNIIQGCAQHETAYLNCACWHSVQERGEVSLNWGLATQNSLKIFSTYDENNRSYDFPLKKGNSRYIAGFRLNHKLLSNQLWTIPGSHWREDEMKMTSRDWLSLIGARKLYLYLFTEKNMSVIKHPAGQVQTIFWTNWMGAGKDHKLSLHICRFIIVASNSWNDFKTF